MVAYAGKKEEKLFGKNFARAVLALGELSAHVPGADGVLESGPARATPVDTSAPPSSSVLSTMPLVSAIPVVKDPHHRSRNLKNVAFADSEPETAAETLCQLRELYGLHYRRWLLRLLALSSFLLNWAPLLGFLWLMCCLAAALLLLAVMPDLPVRLFCWALRLVPAYLHYAGDRISAAVLEELSAGVTSATAGLVQHLPFGPGFDNPATAPAARTAGSDIMVMICGMATLAYVSSLVGGAHAAA